MADMQKKIKKWLEKIGTDEKDILLPSEEEINNAPMLMRQIIKNSIVVPYKLVSKDGALNLTLKAVTIWDDKWIQVKLLLSKGPIPEPLKIPLYEALLQNNFLLNEVTYSQSPSGDIYVETDMPTDTTFENFKSEYSSVVYGADIFFGEIIPKLSEKIEPRDTFEHENPQFFT
ncbi:MAG: hypothetical protein ACTSU2_08185 [Promethearchaeota archaeon]